MQTLLKTIFFFNCIFCTALFTGAQVLNMDKVNAPTDSAKKWHVALDAGADFDSEKKVFDWDTKADITRLLKGKHLITAVFVNSFINTSGQDIQNTGFIHFRYRDNDSRKFSAEYFTQYQWDNLRGMINRYLIGSNLRCRIRESKKMDIYLGVGLMYEWEKWSYSGVAADKMPLNHPAFQNTALLKINQYVKLSTKLFQNTELTITNFFQARPDENIRFPRIADFIEWNIPLSKRVALNLHFQSIYDPAPIVPIRDFHYSYHTGFTISL